MTATLSVAVALMVTFELTVAPANGEMTVMVGGVVSASVMVTAAERLAETLPAASLAQA